MGEMQKEGMEGGTGGSDVSSETLSKIDRRILPPLFFLFFFTIFARNNISNAQDEMLADLHLDANQYSTAVGMFFVTYVPFQIPGNLLLKKLNRPSLMFGVLSVCMGILGCSFSLVKNLNDIMIIRLLVGVVEASVYPGIIFFLTRWYPSARRTRAIGIVLFASGIAGAASGLIAFGVLRMDGILGMKGWQWLLIVEGFPAILFGVLIIVALPDSPATCSFLTEEEKIKILRQNNEKPAEAIEWGKLLELLQNWRLWLMGVILGLNGCASYGMSYFLPPLIDQFGYNPIISEVLTIPAIIPGSIFALSFAYWVQRNGHFAYYSLFGCILSVLGAACLAIAVLLDLGRLRYFALLVQSIFASCWTSAFLTWMTSELKGSATITAVGIALTNSMGNVGGIIGPKIMSRTEMRYGGFGIGLLTLCFLLCAAFLLMLFLVVTRRNMTENVASTPPYYGVVIVTDENKSLYSVNDCEEEKTEKTPLLR